MVLVHLLQGVRRALPELFKPASTASDVIVPGKHTTETERYACLRAGAIAVNLPSFFKIPENRNVTYTA
jgi:hypothetical protein